MKSIVYLGSTLPLERARQLAPELEYRPPVRQGDVYRAVRAGARLVGIVDGELDQALPVWHKELLWAISEGVRVLGAASMGALRAAELESFGMIGVGRVHAWFRDGVLEDDDEVVVTHATSEFGYRPLSDAMVNIRATLDHALELGVLDAEGARELVRRAKGLHYSERNFGALRALCRDGAIEAQTRRFWEELTTLNSDVKAADAQLLIERMRELRRGAAPEAGAAEATTGFELAHTSAWQAFIEYHAPPSSAGSEPGARALLEAYHRALALELARATGIHVSGHDIQATSEAFRRTRGLHDPQRARAWLEARKISLEGFSRLMRDEAVVQAASPAARTTAQAQLAIVEWLARWHEAGDGT